MQHSYMKFFDNLVSEEDRMIRATARKFADREIAPHAHAWEEAEDFPRELYKKAGDAGIMGIGFPEHAGGAGGGPMAQIMAIEGLLRGGSTGVAVGLFSAGIAMPPLINAGNPQLIERFVKPTLAGDKVAALAVTEPGAGSDVAGITTRAVKDGDDYIVTGNKIFITSGVKADILTTLVRTGDDPHQGVSFLVIEKDMPGVIVSRSLKKTGWRASDTAELAFDEVRVPQSHLVGSEGAAFILLMQNFQMERLALAAYGALSAEIAYEEAIAYAKERKAFGKKLTGFQVTRHKLADMGTKVLTAKTLLYQVANRMEAGEEVIAEVSMCKNFCAQIAQEVCYDAVQILGGMGYMRESIVERLSRDVRILPIGGGTTEVMKEIISKRVGY